MFPGTGQAPNAGEWHAEQGKATYGGTYIGKQVVLGHRSDPSPEHNIPPDTGDSQGIDDPSYRNGPRRKYQGERADQARKAESMVAPVDVFRCHKGLGIPIEQVDSTHRRKYHMGDDP